RACLLQAKQGQHHKADDDPDGEDQQAVVHHGSDAPPQRCPHQQQVCVLDHALVLEKKLRMQATVARMSSRLTCKWVTARMRVPASTRMPFPRKWASNGSRDCAGGVKNTMLV